MSQRKVVALLLNSAGLAHDYQAGLRLGVEQACRAHDLDLWVYAGQSAWTAAPAQLRVYKLMDPSRIAGIVLASALISSWTNVQEVLAMVRDTCPVPICSVGQLCEGMPNLLVDNVAGAGQIVEHLVTVHSRRKFAFIGGPRGHLESDQRLRGVRQALARHGLELRPEAVAFGDFSTATGRDLAGELVRRGVEFDAIVAANDDSALGALSYLTANGLLCPADVSITGFDDTPSAALSPPPLTTARQPLHALGAAAVDCLVDLWQGRTPPGLTTFETEVIVRESCGCRATGVLAERVRQRHTDHAGGARASHAAQFLSSLLNSEPEALAWEKVLHDAIAAERSAAPGALVQALETLIEQLPDSYLPIHELQHLISGLRDEWQELGSCAAIEDAFHAARALVGWHAFRRAGELSLRNANVLEDIRISWDSLATSFNLPALKRALTTELLRLAIRNAFIALYAPDGTDQLVPLVCLENGVPMELAAPYAAKLLIPDGVFDQDQLYALSVLPLTSEPDPIGVAVLELPPRGDIYMLLREQISSAVKAVRMHEETLVNARLQAQAQEEKRVTSERLRSLSLIAGGVAHDLNNVLGPLVGLPEMIRRDLERLAPLPVEVANDLETIRRAAQRAAQTIGDLLSLGRPEQKHETTLELSRLLLTEQATFVGLVEADDQIEVRVETSARSLVVRASKLQLVRAISNLVLNAVDAVEGRGIITVRALHVVLAERIEGVEQIEPGEYAVIEVEDTGAGIPPGHLQQIFEPFFTSRHRGTGTGTGLGLAIVRRVVKDSFGYVQVRSELGKGTVFSLYFPLDPQPPSTSVIPAAVAGGNERILVVDDEPVQIRTARRILEGIGYSVTTARSGEEAIAICSGETPAVFDLVVVDILMPGLDGVSTVERLREIRPGQRALLASGYSPEQIDPTSQLDVLPARRTVRCLAKPYTGTALAAAVREVLDADPPKLGDTDDAGAVPSFS